MIKLLTTLLVYSLKGLLLVLVLITVLNRSVHLVQNIFWGLITQTTFREVLLLLSKIITNKAEIIQHKSILNKKNFKKCCFGNWNKISYRK